MKYIVNVMRHREYDREFCVVEADSEYEAYWKGNDEMIFDSFGIFDSVRVWEADLNNPDDLKDVEEYELSTII